MTGGEGLRGTLRRLDGMAWLRPDLARLSAWALLVGLATIPLGWIVLAQDGIRHTGIPLAADFTAYWTAARFAFAGAPLSAYDPAAMQAAQDALWPGRDFGYLGFYYPPGFLLLLAPLGSLTRETAALLFLALGGLAYGLALRPLLPRGGTVAALFAFPAVLVVLDYGQNGLLSAALLGVAALCLDRRPALAGIAFGLLAYKPQLGLLVPLLLIAAGRWRCFSWASATVLAVVAAATAGFGPEIWTAFLRNSAHARAQLEQGLVDYGRMASLYAALRMAGFGAGVGFAVQGVAALIAAGVVVGLARRVADGRALVALVVAAIPFSVPYFYEYDAVILAVPMAWLLAEGARAGFRGGERSILVLSFFAPLIASVPGVMANLVALAATALLLAAVARRAATMQNGATATRIPP